LKIEKKYYKMNFYFKLIMTNNCFLKNLTSLPKLASGRKNYIFLKIKMTINPKNEHKIR